MLETIQRHGRHSDGEFAHRSEQVAVGDVDDFELSKRREQLGDSSRYRPNAKVGLVFAASDSSRHARWRRGR